MENQVNGNQFRDDEIVIMNRFNEEVGGYVNVVYPKIGGRLRLAHEENEQLSIITEVITNDEHIAIVKAVTTTPKGCFAGVGMASSERDATIAPAILELAETGAIARSLRFAGYGVEYCSAEEISHLENGNGNGNNPAPENRARETGLSSAEPTRSDTTSNSRSTSRNKAGYSPRGGTGNGRAQSKGGNGSNGNGTARITNKQLGYIVNLGQDIGLDSKGLDQESLEMFGVRMSYLTTKDASAFIDSLKRKAA